MTAPEAPVPEQAPLPEVAVPGTPIHETALQSTVPQGADKKTQEQSVPVLEARDVDKVFTLRRGLRIQSLHALSGVSLSLHAGQVHAVVGESGSGKSTLARILVRLTLPTRGQILFQGVDMARANRDVERRFRRGVQMIFQDPFASLNPVRSLGHHLERPLRIANKSLSRAEIRACITQLLESVGLDPNDDFLRRYPHELSGGQRQRVAIARALATNPAVLLADEPTSMLDVSIRAGVLSLLQRLTREHGIACLYITHDIASARHVADEICVMYGGRIVERTTGDQLVTAPAHPYTQLLLASVPGHELSPHRQGPAILHEDTL